jgi:hypothetical protein
MCAASPTIIKGHGGGTHGQKYLRQYLRHNVPPTRRPIMVEIRFRPLMEHGKPAVRAPNTDEWYMGLDDGFAQARGKINYNYPIYTRSEVEVPDPEPIGWKLMKTGDFREARCEEWFVNDEGDPERWWANNLSSTKYPILSCTPIYEGEV